MKSFKNLHLAVSVLLIVPVALVYGLLPGKILPGLFDFTIHTTDLSIIFRATMGLYLGMAVFWIMGIVKSKTWVAATTANIFFMGGLAIGRIVSLLLDGSPNVYFLTGLFVELLLALWGIRNLKKYS
jgi:hypothetical protein